MKKFTYSLLGASCLVSCFSWAGIATKSTVVPEVSLSNINALEIKLPVPLYQLTGVKNEPAGSVALNYVSKTGKQTALKAQVNNSWLELPATLPSYKKGDQIEIGNEKLDVGDVYRQLNKKLGVLSGSGKVSLSTAHDACDNVISSSTGQNKKNIYYLYGNGKSSSDKKATGATLRLKVVYTPYASSTGRQLERKSPLLFSNIVQAVGDTADVTWEDPDTHSLPNTSFTKVSGGANAEQFFGPYDHSQDQSVACTTSTADSLKSNLNSSTTVAYYDMQQWNSSGSQLKVCAVENGVSSCTSSTKDGLYVQSKSGDPDTKDYTINCDYPAMYFNADYPATSNVESVTRCWIGPIEDSENTTFDGKAHAVSSPSDDVTGYPKSVLPSMYNSGVTGSASTSYAQSFNYSKPDDVFAGYLESQDMWEYVESKHNSEKTGPSSYGRETLVLPYTQQALQYHADGSYSSKSRGYNLGSPDDFRFTVNVNSSSSMYFERDDLDMYPLSFSVSRNKNSMNDLIIIAAATTDHNFDDSVPRGKLTAVIQMYDQWGRVYTATPILFNEDANNQ